jgi:hypothetical protein
MIETEHSRTLADIEHAISVLDEYAAAGPADEEGSDVAWLIREALAGLRRLERIEARDRQRFRSPGITRRSWAPATCAVPRTRYRCRSGGCGWEELTRDGWRPVPPGQRPAWLEW